VLTAGDSTLIVEFEERIDEAINRQVVALATTIREAALEGVRDVVPAYRSLAVYFDPLTIDRARLAARISTAEAGSGDLEADAVAPVRVAVCYGRSFGPDLADVAAFGGMSEASAVALHVQRVYRVYMLGFLPGFAYMGAVDERLAMPRRSTPRLEVAAGSVAIAGPQTGIYPIASPGGWQIIGRTPLRMFDASRSDPFLLHPGDTVQFHPIDEREFSELGGQLT
jgi:KipI family sensor histidine kinase inhibitor